MPPSNPSRTGSTRRAQRKQTEEELKDIELKRLRGELSCAECRRLKLRCDKKVPCSSCCRRGCESICPCGILSAGQGTRFILADTEHLHRKIADMSLRIRQLEDALAVLQSTISDQRHPLLQDELLKIKFGPETPEGLQTFQTEFSQTVTQSIDALGTLTLGDSGEMKYFGGSAGSETLMMAGEEWDGSEDGDDEEEPFLTPELENLANLFPFTRTKRSNSKTIELLESHLPTHDRALSLCDSYLKHAAYFFRPIKRDELIDDFMPSIYNARASNGVSADSSSTLLDQPRNSPHALATLYFVFALGALLDLDLSPYNAEAEHYYELARATMSLRLVFESPHIDTVQAIGLMATYHSLAGKKYSRDSAWCVMSFAAKLAQGIGLHRDSSRWNMDTKTVQKRRILFWEVFSADVSHSLALGRPPAIHLSYVDCEFPLDEEATLSDSGEIQNGFWRMKYTFTRDMFLAVAETTLTAKSPTYATILELDRKVREFSFPTSVKPYALKEDGEEEFFSSSLSLQGFYASQYRTVTMIYLHRSFFAQAMLDHPSDPMLSPFATSFLTAYRCAAIIIKASVHQFDRCAKMAMRVWILMYHTFSAAIIVGTVVTRSPNSTVAASALQDLMQAVELFERTAVQSQRAKVALSVLQKLKEKAIRSYEQYISNKTATQPPAKSPNVLSSSTETDNGDDELAIFGGQTRVLARKSRSRRTAMSSGSPDSSSSPPSVDGSASPPDANVHNEPNLQNITSITSIPDSYTVSMDYPFSGPLHGEHGANTNLSNAGNSMNYPPHLTYSSPPDYRMGELSSTFWDYMGNIPTSGGAVDPLALLQTQPSHSYFQPAQTRPNIQPWNTFPPDATGLPEPDTSFGWLPPQYQGLGRPNLQEQHRIPQSSNPSNNHTTRSSTGLVGLTTSSPFSQSGLQYEHTAPLRDNNREMPMIVDPAGTLVELGLMTESDINSAWFTFVQDCGIMDNTTSGSIAGIN